jgi:transcriptional regulator with XRE-family HTH domain
MVRKRRRLDQPLQTVGALIRDARVKKGMSKAELARRVGVTRGAVWEWERDNCFPHRDNARSIAEILGVPLNALLGALDSSSSLKFVTEGLPKRRVPLFSHSQIKSATRGEAVGRTAGSEQFSDLFCEASDRAYALVVQGEDMSPRFMPGDIIVVDPTLKPADNDYVIFDESEEGEVFLRQYRARGEHFDLVALHPDHLTISTGKDRPAPRILGVVVQHTHTFQRAGRPINSLFSRQQS